MKKLLTPILALLTTLVASSAFAQPAGIDHRRLDSVGRSRDYLILDYQLESTKTTSVGIAGIVAKSGDLACSADSDCGAGGTCTGGVCVTMTIETLVASGAGLGAFPYPTRLTLDIRDGSSDSTPACTRYQISGYGWNGMYVSEDVTTSVSETDILTNHSFESLLSLKFSGCTGGDSNDQIVVTTSEWVAMPVLIRQNTDVIYACQTANDGSAGSGNDWGEILCKNGTNFTYHYPSNTIDLDTASTGFTDADEDTYWFRVRTTPR